MKKENKPTKTKNLDKTSHYLTLVALVISNLSVLTLGGIFSSQLGQGMGDVAAIGDQLKVEKSLAAVRKIMIVDSGGGTADPTLNVSISFREPGRIVTGLSDMHVGRIALTAKKASLQINGIQVKVLPPDGGIAAGGGSKSVYKRLLLYDRSFPYDAVASTTIATTTASTSPNMNIGFNTTMIPLRSIVVQKNQTREFSLRADFEAPFIPYSTLPSGAGNALQLSGFNVTSVNNPAASVIINGVGGTFSSYSIVKARSQIFSGTRTVAGLYDRTKNWFNKFGRTVKKLFGFKLAEAQVSIDFPPLPRDIELHKFHVYQENSGPGGLAKLTYRFATSGIDLIPNGFSVYASNSDTVLGNRIAGNQDTVLRGDTLHVRFDVNDDDSNPHNRPGITDGFILNANQSYYFTLRGNVLGSGTVTTSLLSDSGFANNRRVNVIEVENSGRSNFIWSDLNFDLYSSSTATNNAGWFNGFRLFP